MNITAKPIAKLWLTGSLLAGVSASPLALAVTCATDTNANHVSAGRAYNYGYFTTTGYDWLGYNANESKTLLKGLNPWDSMYWYLDTYNLCASATVAPTLDSMSAAVQGADATVSGTASDADGDLSKVLVQLGSNTPVDVSVDSNGNWTKTFSNLANGNYSVSAKAVDSENQESASQSRSFTVDVVAGPQAPTISDIDNTVSGSSVTLSGTAADANGNLDRVEVTLYDASVVNATLNTGGSWSHTIASHPTGTSFSASAVAYDTDGLSSSTSNISYDVSLQPACDPNDLDLADIASAKSTISFNYDMHAFIVKHCGTIVDSWFKAGNGLNTPHELQSATKTVSALVLGNLMYNEPQLFPQGVNTPLKDVLPSQFATYFQGAANAWKNNITIKHVLSMTTGLFWDDGINGGTSSFVEIEDNTNASSFTSVHYILSQDQFTDSSKSFGKFFYNTGSSHLVSAIVHYNAPGGLDTADYADANIFAELGIGSRRIPDAASDIQGGTPGTNGAAYGWPVTPDGIHTGGWASSFKPDDFNNMGELLLNDGVWNGQRLIAADYVAAMTVEQVSVSASSGYGYQMWIPNDYGTPVAAARGWGGQEVHVLPELDLVVTFLGDSTSFNAGSMGSTIDGWMKNDVLPAHADY